MFVALAALQLLVVVLPVWRGGVGSPLQLAAVLFAALALFLAASSQSGTVAWVTAAFALATVWIGIQLVPFPSAGIRLLSPNADALFRYILGPIGEYPAARPLSLDPPATGRDLAKAVTFVLAMAASGLLAGRQWRRDRLLATVAFSGVLVASAGLVAALANLGPLLEPRFTFYNPNHLAGFLTLSSFIALGFAFRLRRREAALWFFAFVVSAAGVFLSLSRGGISAFFVGAGVFALLHTRRLRIERNEPRLRYAGVPAALALALAVVAYLALDRVVAEMRTVAGAANEVKLALVPVALSIVRRFPLIGIGRGAFETFFAAYKVEPEQVTFTYLENEWLQPIVDLGIPVGILLVAAVAWTWSRAARSRDLSRPEIGALAGTAALAAQNLVDFSLELLGVAIPFAVVLGVLSRAQPSLPLRPRTIRIAGLGSLLLAMGGIALWLRHPTEVDARRVAGAREPADVVAGARAAAMWHPADFVPQAAAGIALVKANRCPEALPWLNRAMKLNPTAAEPHRFAGRCLAAAGEKAFAKREYRLAALFGDPNALAEATRHFPELDDLVAIAPDTPSGLIGLASLLAADRPGDAASILRRAWTDYRDVASLRWLAQLTLQLDDPEEALELASKLRELQPLDFAGFTTAAAALEKLDRSEEAKGLLEEGARRIPGSPQILQLLIQQAMRRHLYSEARRLAETITTHAPGEVASKHLTIAAILWAQGRHAEAIQAARRGAEMVPDSPGPKVALSNYAAGAGRYEEAIAALESAAGLPSVPAGTYDGRLAELRAARQRQIDASYRQALDLKQSRP